VDIRGRGRGRGRGREMLRMLFRPRCKVIRMDRVICLSNSNSNRTL
jgi:hypothetical protein